MEFHCYFLINEQVVYLVTDTFDALLHVTMYSFFFFMSHVVQICYKSESSIGDEKFYTFCNCAALYI